MLSRGPTLFTPSFTMGVFADEIIDFGKQLVSRGGATGQVRLVPSALFPCG